MLRYHMVMVTQDSALRRAVKRLTTATGSTADFLTDPAAIPADRPPHLAIFDARGTMPDETFLRAVPQTSKIVYIVNRDPVEALSLFKDERVTSLFYHDAQFDDDEFIQTATKALRGEIFGLQKCFPWGVTSFSMLIHNYDEKIRAIDVLLEYASAAGCRGSVRDRLQLVCDELIMNALYHAPVDEHNRQVHRKMFQKEMANLSEMDPIQVQYACSGRYFGIAVRDRGGSLERETVLEYLERANDKGNHTIESKPTGAGLGLISVLRTVSKLMFNLQSGKSTEIIALFDMELVAKGKIGARSLHMFTAPRERAVEDTRTAPQRLMEAVPWGPVAVAILLVVIVGMGGALYFRGGLSQAATVATVGAGANAAAAEAAPGRTLTVYADPSDARVLLDGKPIEPGVRIRLPAEATHDSVLSVERVGYEPRNVTLSPAAGGQDQFLYVTLIPSPQR